MTAVATRPRLNVKDLPALEEVEAEICRRSLRAFVRRAWHVVEPATPFVAGWHIDAVCEHLEAVEAGQIRRLLMNFPPRHMKSLMVGVLWPTWIWVRRPDRRFLNASYIAQLATRDCVKSRRLITSPWFQARFGHRFHLTGDQNEKTKYENNASGFRAAYGVGGATGEGGDFIVVDDPHNIIEGESEARRGEVLIWWDEVMSTRLNDPKTGAHVIVMQRVHERDLSGHVLEQGGYEHLMLPAEYDPKRSCVTVLGQVDPRITEGELLWPERFDAAAIAQLKTRLGSYGTAGQLQQQPTARKGGAFDRAWFDIVAAAPRRARRVRYWDKAGTQGGGKYSTGLRMAYYGGEAWIEDVVRGQWSAANREQVMRQTAEADASVYGLELVIVAEQEPGSGGKESAELTIKSLAGYSVYADRPTGDKFVRARPLSAAAEAGNVHLVRGDWNEAFVRELNAAGPGAAFLDQMDAAAGAYNRVTLGTWPSEPAPDEDEFTEGFSL